MFTIFDTNHMFIDIRFYLSEWNCKYFSFENILYLGISGYYPASSLNCII